MIANALAQRFFGSPDREDMKNAVESKEFGYSFEAIDLLDEEVKRLYRIWLNTASDYTRATDRYSVTLDDVKATMSDALKKFADAER